MDQTVQQLAGASAPHWLGQLASLYSFNLLRELSSRPQFLSGEYLNKVEKLSEKLEPVRANDKSSLLHAAVFEDFPRPRLFWNLRNRAIAGDSSSEIPETVLCTPPSSWSPETRRCSHSIDSFSGGEHCGHSETVIRERQSSNWAWQTHLAELFFSIMSSTPAAFWLRSMASWRNFVYF